MKIEIRIDGECEEPRVIVMTASMTEEVDRIVQTLNGSGEDSRLISGTREGRVEVIERDEIISVYTASRKVYALTEKGTFELRHRLYEMERMLDPKQFVRISNSEIINMRKVSHFDLNFVGTICVKMKDGTVTYVSRRYVSKVKEILGV